MRISYNWLKWYIPEVPEPKHLADIFTYHICEVESVTPLTSPTGEKDWVFDLGILPNRAHDLLSHHGVAKELSGLLGIKYNDPTPYYKIPASTPTQLSVDAGGARRYMARIIRNVTVGPSPDWVREHLESIGQRSINNVVDATNITMYDSGNPTHAFDLDKIKGNIVVRDAVKGETMTTLDGKDVTLNETDVVIADDLGVLALAGVKGGNRAQVTTDTKNILIEVANFFPVRVRKTARRLGILTDSAKRFENDLSPELCSFAMTELSGLFVEYGCTDFEDIIDMYPFDGFKNTHTVSFSASYIGRTLGVDVPESEIEKILKNYKYAYTKSEDDISVAGVSTRGPEISSSDGVNYNITIPSLRLDLRNKEDFAEEIGRVYGYDKVVPVLPKLDFTPKINETYAKIQSVYEALVSDGYREVMTYAFANTGDVEVLASASDKKFLRTNLTDGIKKSYEMNKLNLPLLGGTEVKIFEIGTVFKNGKEEIHIAYANKKEVKEMTLDAYVDSHSASDIEKYPHSPEEGSVEEKENKYFKMWSTYPFIARDIAVWVPESVTPESLKEIYQEFGTELLQGEPVLFDSFTKEGRTSYAFRLIFQSYDRTLTDEEVSLIMSNITEKITSLGYTPR